MLLSQISLRPSRISSIYISRQRERERESKHHHTKRRISATSHKDRHLYQARRTMDDARYPSSATPFSYFKVKQEPISIDHYPPSPDPVTARLSAPPLCLKSPICCQKAHSQIEALNDGSTDKGAGSPNRDKRGKGRKQKKNQ